MHCINPNTPQYQEILKEVGNPLTADEIYRQRYLKDGVDELFKSNPKLSSMGTQEEYSSYLDTIFPESKVKDIVYHGSKSTLKLYNGKVIDSRFILSEPDEKGAQTMLKALTEEDFNNLPNARFEKFRKKEHGQGGLDKFLGSGHYFTTSLKDAQKYAGTNLYSAIINVKNAYTEGNGYSNSRSGKGSQELINQGYDAVTEKINNGQEYNVFEPEQIHILGGEEDIRMFQDYLENKRVEDKRLTPEKMELLAMARETLSEEEVSIVENILNGDENFTDMSNFTCS